MSQVINDATSAMNDIYDDALDDNVPLGEFLHETLAITRAFENFETDEELGTENLETDPGAIGFTRGFSQDRK